MTQTEQDLRARIAADIIAELTRAQAAWRNLPDADMGVITGRAWYAAAMRQAADVARGDQAATRAAGRPTPVGVAR